MRRKIGAIAITAIILILALTYVTTPPSHSTPLDGIPISDSVFADLVKPEPDPVVFPQFPVVETPSSITMEFDYTGFEKVNESVALTASIDFISQIWYLSELNLSTDSIVLEEELWYLRFIDESVDVGAYVRVNAMSGKVCYFSSTWPAYESPFHLNVSENQFASSAELEELAVNFFYQLNYSLSPHARYVAPELFHDHVFRHDVYVISFSNVVNDTLIDGKVLLYLDVKASAVLRFSYSWVHVDAIPKENIISLEQTKQEVRNHFKDTINMSPFSIRSVTLLFNRITTVVGDYYRLGWIVSIDNEFVARAKIDAISGVMYDVGYHILTIGQRRPTF